MIEIWGHRMQLQKILFPYLPSRPPCLLLLCQRVAVNFMTLFNIQATGTRDAYPDHHSPGNRPSAPPVSGVKSRLPSVPSPHTVSSSWYAAVTSQRSTRAESHPTWYASPRTAKYSSSKHRDEATANGTADAHDGTTEPRHGTTSECYVDDN